jgi:hypothetical protein
LEHIVSSTTNLRLFRGIVLRTLINSHCSNLIPNWRKDYSISFIGAGTYELDAEVVDKLTNYNFDHTHSGGQTLTSDNVLTRQLTLDGKFGLKYNAKLK